MLLLSALLVPTFVASGSLALAKSKRNPALIILGLSFLLLAVILGSQVASGINQIAENALR